MAGEAVCAPGGAGGFKRNQPRAFHVQRIRPAENAGRFAGRAVGALRAAGV